jgi:hypothetical protein
MAATSVWDPGRRKDGKRVCSSVATRVGKDGFVSRYLRSSRRRPTRDGRRRGKYSRADAPLPVHVAGIHLHALGTASVCFSDLGGLVKRSHGRRNTNKAARRSWSTIAETAMNYSGYMDCRTGHGVTSR